MSDPPDPDRIRELLRQLDGAQLESERIRGLIERIRGASTEFPDRRRVSRLFDDDPGPSENDPS